MCYEIFFRVPDHLYSYRHILAIMKKIRKFFTTALLGASMCSLLVCCQNIVNNSNSATQAPDNQSVLMPYTGATASVNVSIYP